MPKYQISLSGEGGEFIAGIVSQEFFDALEVSGISIEDYAKNNLDDEDYAVIPEDCRPFSPGEWFEINFVVHNSCCAADGGEVSVWDEDIKSTIYEAPINGAIEGPSHEIGDNEDDAPGFSVYDPGDKWKGQIAYTCMRHEDGIFFDGVLEVDEPFDPSKLMLCTSNYNERDMVTKVMYFPDGFDEDGIEVEGKFGGSDINDTQHELRIMDW